MEELILNSNGRGGNQEKNGKVSFITRETVGMTMLLFGAIAFLITVTGRYLFGGIGTKITAFFVGTFGFLSYPLLLLVVYLSFTLVFGKKLVSSKWLLKGCLLVVSVFLIVHTATAARFFNQGDFSGYGGYLGGCWNAAVETAREGTGGGVLLGLIVYPVAALLHNAGAYVLFSLLTALAIYLILLGTPLRKYISLNAQDRAARPERKKPAVHTDGVRDYPVPLTFDDIPAAPRHSAMPQAQNGQMQYGQSPYAQQPPVQPQYVPPQYAEPKPVQPAVQDPRASIFGDTSAQSYRENRIFASDSYFNTHTVKSNLERRSAAEPPTYSEKYSGEAEKERPAMPRRVTEERATGVYEYPVTDVNYPQTPSFRAPEPMPPKEETHDFYSSDVPLENDFSAEELTSEPPYEEEPQTYEPRTYEPPVTFDPPVSRDPEPPMQSTVEREVPPTPERPVYGRGLSEEEVSRERGFRSLFSGGGRNVDLPVRPSEPPAPYSSDPSPSAPFADANEPKPELPESLRLVDPAEGVDTPLPESRVLRSDLGRNNSNANLFDDNDMDEVVEEPPVEEPPVTRPSFRGERGGRATFRDVTPPPMAPVPEEAAPTPKKHVYKPYVKPALSNFRHYDDKAVVPQDEIERNSTTIVDTLAGFNISSNVVRVTVGPTVTRYDIDIPGNVPIQKVLNKDDEIALRLHARDGVKIFTNSEVGAISIEVPNTNRATVGMRSVMQADEYVNSKPGSLMFVIGKSVEGKNVCGNIPKMTHILVAGGTNSGKSVCLNAMLLSLICKYSPEELRLILIDPKKIEFAPYEGIPHLMINEIITDSQKAVTALNWCIKEMERRYDLFEQKTRSGTAVRNVDEYNFKSGEDEEKLPKIVVVVDEFADLMVVARKDIEERVQRLTQKARAAGMHLVIATQRPSVNVITGVIKSNLPTRMALRTAQENDSRIILDEGGAEKLLGYGDMLFRSSGMNMPLRVQGAFASDDEVQAILDDVRANNESYYDDEISTYINRTESVESSGDAMDGADAEDVDPQYIKALGIVVKLGQASISLIQRKCGVGYNHAGKIVEWMEMMGYITPFDGKAKARDVILTKEEFEQRYGSID